jgi:hypothetical protein
MAITASEIIEMIVGFGLEYFRVYPGLYRGIVTRNDDPDKRGRIQARVPCVHSDAPNIWIKPTHQGAGANRGSFWPPEVGDTVFVSFAQGKPGRPELYIGGWYGNPNGETEVPTELGYSGDYPDKRGFVTRMGHVLLFNDEEGNESIELIWNKADSGDEAFSDRTKTAARPGSASNGGGTAHLKFQSDGSIEIQDNNATSAQKITLNAEDGEIVVSDANGNIVTLNSSGARIDSTAIDIGGDATEPAMLGDAWKAWAEAHTHGTAWGPSGPPLQPPTPTILSQVVKVK